MVLLNLFPTTTSPASVIFDSDGAIDDCLALFLLLFADKIGLVRLLAITSAPGSTTQEYALKNICRILEAAKRTDIPVYRGASSTFSSTNFPSPLSYGVDGFGDVPWSTEPNDCLCLVRSTPAAVAMTDIVKSKPGKVTIIGTAPPTNIVLAAKLDDKFLSLTKEIRLVVGNYKGIGSITPYAEWNAYVDAVAANMLLNMAKEACVKIILVTTEAVQETNISLDWLTCELWTINNPVINVIKQAEATIYPRVYTKYLPADAYSPATFIQAAIATKYESYPASVVKCDCCLTRGQVTINFRDDIPPNAQFIESVDGEKFKALLVNAAKSTQYSFQRPIFPFL